MGRTGTEELSQGWTLGGGVQLSGDGHARAGRCGECGWHKHGPPRAEPEARLLCEGGLGRHSVPSACALLWPGCCPVSPPSPGAGDTWFLALLFLDLGRYFVYLKGRLRRWRGLPSRWLQIRLDQVQGRSQMPSLASHVDAGAQHMGQPLLLSQAH